MRGAVTLAAVLALVLAVSMLSRFIDRVIFQPTPGADFRPEEFGVPGEDVTLRSEDGVRLHAFYLAAPGASRALLFLHGNAGNASHRLPNAAELVRLGTHVMLPDYRGYGLSEGVPSEEGVYADARAALAHLVQVRGVPEERIVIFGRSLGGAVAVELARGRPLAGVILESTFSSARDVAARSFGSTLAGIAGRRFESARKIAEVRAPLLFFHGDRDEIVDIELGRVLFEAASGPKHFETIRGAGHNDLTIAGGRPYFARIGRFLDEVAPAP